MDMQFEDSYTRDLEKAFRQIKMENATLINLIGAILCCSDIEHDVESHTAEINAEQFVLNYNVHTERSKKGLIVHASINQDAE